MNSKNQQIWIDASLELTRKTGVGAYILNLIRGLNILQHKYVIIENKLPTFLKYKFVFHTIWLNTIFYLKTLIKKPDIIIFPNFIMPFIKRKNIQYITVIHDLAYLRKNEISKYTEVIYKYAVRNAIKNADIIITVSNAVKQEIVEIFSYESEKIKVVHNSIAKNFIKADSIPERLKKYDIESQKYILSVATMNKRKNVPMLIKAFEQISDLYPEVKLVLVGGIGNENIESLTLNKNIIFTGYIPDEELPTLYKNALFYVFPSCYEGFGIPIIEAQYFKCPVLCSNIPVFREIAGNGAEYTNISSEEIAKNLNYLINDKFRRKKLIELGTLNIERFNMENMSRQLKEVLNVNL